MLFLESFLMQINDYSLPNLFSAIHRDLGWGTLPPVLEWMAYPPLPPPPQDWMRYPPRLISTILFFYDLSNLTDL